MKKSVLVLISLLFSLSAFSAETVNKYAPEYECQVGDVPAQLILEDVSQRVVIDFNGEAYVGSIVKENNVDMLNFSDVDFIEEILVDDTRLGVVTAFSAAHVFCTIKI